MDSPLIAGMLPMILALVLAPHASLRNWLAVSRLPELALPVEDAAAIKKHRKRRSVLFLLTFAAFIGLEMACFAYADEGVINKIVMVVLAMFVQVSVTVVMAEATGACQWAAFRTEQGRLFFRIVPESKKRFRMAASFIAAGLLNAAAIYYPHQVLLQAVVACIAYRLVASTPSRTISIRGVMALLLGWLAVSFTLSGILIAVLIKSGNIDEVAKDLDAEALAVAEASPAAAQLERMSGRLLQVITKSWFTAAPGVLLAALYRFDYSQHIKRQAEEGNVNAVEVDFVEPIKTRCFGTSSPGVIVPTTVTRGFKVTFYQTAMSAWAISHVLVAIGVEHMPLGDANKDDVTGILELALEIPAMVVASLVCAKVTGQFRDMWTYREEYSKKPSSSTPAVAPASSSSEVDVKLPSYSDATDAEEGVPPYQIVDTKA